MADGDDVQRVPVVRLVDGVDRGLVAQRCQQPRALAGLGAHDLTLPRDDAAPGGLLVKLTGVPVRGVEVVLRAGHVPFGFRRRVWWCSACGAARTRWLRVAAP